MRKVAFVIIVLAASLAFPSVYTPLRSPSTARALPALSGAVFAEVPNGDFSGVGLGDVGTPPTNYDFETPGGAVGTPPSNYDFGTGDFSGWTLTGTPTVQTGGPGGYYARLASGQRVLSSAIAVDASAQALTFNVAAVNSGTFQWQLNIYSGSGYATKTTKYFTSCPSACTNWNIYSADAVAWRGQSIKLEVQQFIGSLNVDDVGVQQEILPGGWSPSSGDKVMLASGGTSGSFAQTTTAITSPTFVVDSAAQNGKLNLRVSSTSGSYSIKVLSGPTYSTATTVYTGKQDDSSTWATRSFALGDYVGQSVKLQVIPSSSELQVDQAGLMENVVPGWTPSGTSALSVKSEGGFGYASQVGTINTGTFYMDGQGWAGGNRGNWFKITYRMKHNYNVFDTDLGSTLQVWIPGDPSPSFTAAGKQQGAPYDPTDVWLEKYFFVYGSYQHATMVTPRTISFRVNGWPAPPYGTCPSKLGCGGSPDVASIVAVDGPGPNKILRNPAAGSVTPPGLCGGTTAMCSPMDATTENTNDPVDVISGNFFQSHTDLAIAAPGVPATFTRAYSAQARASGSVGTPSVLGAKWSHNWQASLTEASSGSMVVISLPGGATQSWTYSGGAWRPPTGFEGTLVKNAGGDWTLRTRNQLVYAFDSSGRWTSITDRNGNATALSYNGSGQLASVTDAVGRSMTLTYGASGYGAGRITSVSDASGRSVSYGYDASGDLVTVTDVMGGTVSYQYSGHLLTQGTDTKGHVFVRNTYDGKGRVTSQLDAANGQTTIAYDTPGAGATRVTDQRGKQTTYYFDQQMRVTDVVDHNGNVTSTAWDSANNKTSVTNALGKTWQYTYDSHHNVLTVKDPLLKTWTYTYNSRNDLLTATDPLSRTTTYAYDSTGNLTSMTDANSKVTTLTVNSRGLVTQVTDPLSHSTSFGYDTYGNRTTVTNALSKTWTTAYDTAGRATSVTDPLSHATSYTYSNGNNVLTVTDPLSHVTTYTYDANGNVLTVTDANSKVTTYAYDVKDQLSSITDAASGVTSFTYDAVGNIAAKQNPRGKTTAYTYDDLSRLLTETDPLSHLRAYGYDAAGRLTSRQDAKSQTITYTYNDRNELTNITYPDTSFVSFTYDDAGHRTQMVDATGTTSYSYDALYRLTGVTFPASRTVGYAYDDAGRETSITYPGGTNQVAYAYDAANRLSTVTDWNSNTTTYGYDDANRMASATLPNGVVSSYAYDNANRLTGINHVKGGTTLASVSYTLDAVGNRSDRTDLAGTQSYGYDNLYRLTSVTYPGPTTTTYSYDAFGNRTQMVDASGTTGYAYDDADRLTAVTPPSPAPVVSYAWDNNGNLTNRGSDSFSWDYEDRMLSATVGGATWTYAYRGDGLRNSATTGGVTKTFTWDVNAGLPVILDDGTQYINGAGLVSQVSGSNTYYYLADGLGSTMATTDASGDVVNSYTYDVYGKTTASSGSQANDFQFAGQQTDPTGLQYLRARYYDPEIGGFLSRDPLAAAPGRNGNGFGYADANPAVNTDPTGNKCFGPVCIDRDGVSVGGHEASEGLQKVADWVHDAAWAKIREAVNRPLSDMARDLAERYGGNCRDIGSGIVGCGGLGGLLDALHISGNAFTLGNVILTREKSVDRLDSAYIEHETRHSDQWALFGLAATATGRSPLEGQAVMFFTYMLNVATVTPFGGGACENVFEIWAGLKNGHYEC